MMGGRRVLLTALVLLTAVAAWPETATAQIKASEAATVSQTIDGTTLTIEYSRPSLRGRDLRTDLLGDQIPWGQTWTPGANQATTLESNRDFTLHGTAVPAGRFSVWMAVEEEDLWTLVLDPRDDLYHVVHPELTEEQIHIPVRTATAPTYAETLVWSFPTVRRDGADLRMHWGDLRVDLHVEVEPTMTVEMTPEEAGPYVGTWAVEQLATNYGAAHEYEFEIEHAESGLLMGDVEFSADFSMTVAFVMAAEQVFRMGILMDGDVAEVDGYAFLEFELDASGTAVAYEQRGPDDQLIARGTRVR